MLHRLVLRLLGLRPRDVEPIAPPLEPVDFSQQPATTIHRNLARLSSGQVTVDELGPGYALSDRGVPGLVLSDEVFAEMDEIRASYRG